MHVILIGFRCTGKSTVARHLALRCGRDWVDCDVEIELRAGKSIRAIFEEQGEPAFRKLEAEVLADLLQTGDAILATGGGVVLSEANRQQLASGKVVWLQASAETIGKRMQADVGTRENRPPLTSLSNQEEVVKLLEERAPLYRQVADLEVDTENKSPSDVASEICQRLKLSPSRESNV